MQVQPLGVDVRRVVSRMTKVRCLGGRTQIGKILRQRFAKLRQGASTRWSLWVTASKRN